MNDRHERYAAAIYESLWPNGEWSLAGRTYYLDLEDAVMAVADEELARCRDELERTHADYLVADRQADEAAAELQHQLRLAQLELMKANVLRELAEIDAAGVKAALKESQEECRVRADVGIEDARRLDKYEAALGDILNALNSGTSLVARTAAIDVILRRAGL